MSRPLAVGWPLRRLYVYRPDAPPGELKDVELHFNPPARVMPIGDDLWRITGMYQTVEGTSLDETLRKFGQQASGAPAHPWEDGTNVPEPVHRLGTALALPGRLPYTEAKRIVREAYTRGRSAQQALRALSRLDAAQYPDLRWVMPPRDQWPKHEPFKCRAQRWGWAEGPSMFTVFPWVRDNNQWWSLSRRYRAGNDRGLAARVYLNGNGCDHELRFLVYLPLEGAEPFGASNSFCRVTPALVEKFNKPGEGSRLGARGLWAPTPEDVLSVMRWCDAMLAEFWPAVLGQK